jgi:hypothetical protein
VENYYFCYLGTNIQKDYGIKNKVSASHPRQMGIMDMREKPYNFESQKIIHKRSPLVIETLSVFVL